MKKALLFLSLIMFANLFTPSVANDFDDDDDYNMYTAGAYKCTRLMRFLIRRAERLNSEFNNFITIDRTNILEQAAAVDWKRLHGEELGDLPCVPVTVKDNIDVKNLPTTAGTPALTIPSNVPSVDAGAVQALRDQDAIIFGKTNMDEMFGDVTGMNFFTDFVNNPFGQQFINGSTVYRISGGSSAGAAVAAATAKLFFLNMGTDTGGSIRIPPSLCGVWGFRPNSTNTTDDGYPVSGVISISTTLDRVGMIARRPIFLTAAHKVLTGNNDPILPTNLNNLRLGYDANEFAGLLDPETRSVFEQALCDLENYGVTIVPIDLAGIVNDSETSNFLVGPYEGNVTLREYLDPISVDLDSLIQQIVTPSVQFLYSQFVIGPLRPTEPDYQFGLFLRELIKERLTNATIDYDLDAFVFPTTIISALPQNEVGQVIMVDGQIVPTFQGYSRNTNLASAASLAGLNVPIGKTSQGAPVGLEIDGFNNRDVLSIGLSLGVVF